jgi:uncharacterized protein (DUF4415 family)
VNVVQGRRHLHPHHSSSTKLDSIKTRITIYIDDDLLEAFRERADAAGRGYQTMINEALREALGKEAQPIDARTLRRTG